MKSTNYIVIQGWMCNELGLKGNELLVFALIYGFSQDGESKFNGGRRYISETFDITLPTVDKILQSLVAKNFIIKQSANDYKHTDSYFITDWVADGVVKKLYEGSKETLLNNNSNNKKEKVVSKDTTTKSGFDFGKQKIKKDSLYTSCANLIRAKSDNADIQKALFSWLNMLLEKYKLRGKVLYVNVFKGKLNMLDKFDEKDWKEIIEFNLQKGYEGFYPIPISHYDTDLKNKPWEAGVKSTAYTEEEKKQNAREREEMEARGERVWY